MKKICFAVLVLLMSRLCAQGQTVTFSQRGGFYENSFAIELSCGGAYQIRYTTNGSTPNAGSTLYEEPLLLGPALYSTSDIYTIQISPDNLVYVPDSVSHCIVIRAAAFTPNGSCVSPVVTNTYLIGSLGCDTHGLAVVSICADSLDLFDYNTGIFVPGVNYDPSNPDHTGNYYQHGSDWERPINVEFYEPDDNSGINQKCGLRTHGNMSRRWPAKGMKIYAREQYGKKRFKHNFFNDPILDSYKHLVIKPLSVGWSDSGIQNFICHKLSRQIGVTSSDSRPVIVFLNGEYWGVYFLHEKMDERFLEDHYQIDINNTNIIESWHGTVDCGDNFNFLQMMSWFEQKDLSNPDNYIHACSLIDIDNFIDYYVFETFIGNYDWPHNNMRCWQEGNDKWRWIFFDGDACLDAPNFDVFANATVYNPPTTWANYPEAKLLFKKLLKNEEFRAMFRARAIEMCDNYFGYENTSSVYNLIVDMLSDNIDGQSHRFGQPSSMDSWEHGNNIINTFLYHRVDNYLAALDEFLNNMDINEVHPWEQLDAFPSPTTGNINVVIANKTDSSLELKMYDITGRIAYSQWIDTTTIQENDLISFDPHLPSGVYVLEMGGLKQKIIIQK